MGEGYKNEEEKRESSKFGSPDIGLHYQVNMGLKPTSLLPILDMNASVCCSCKALVFSYAEWELLHGMLFVRD